MLAFFDDLERIVKEFGYSEITKFAFRELHGTRKFCFFDRDEALVQSMYDFIDKDKYTLEVFCEALPVSVGGHVEVDNAGLTNNRGGNDVLLSGEMNDFSDSEDLDYNPSDKCDTDDGMDAADFSSEDEEFHEARKNFKLAKEHETTGDVDDDDPLRKILAAKKRKGKQSEENTSTRANQTTQQDETQQEEIEESGYHTEYYSSDDYVNTIISSEKGDLSPHRKPRVGQKVYAPNCDHKDLELCIGMRFKNYDECKIGIQTWAILNGLDIFWARSDHTKIEAKCSENCSWRLYVSKAQNEKTFVIKILEEDHACARSNYNKQANCDWISKQFLGHFKKDPNYAPKEMVKDIQLAYDTDATLMQCYRAKWKTLNKLRGTFEEHYSKVRSYVAELMRMDKEGSFVLKTEIDTNDMPVFKRLYIGFSALRKGFFAGCRRVLGFDACFLKTVLGVLYWQQLPKMITNKMYPVAWAVVEKENEETWTWFFDILFKDLHLGDGFGWTFTSDQQKGLINGIKTVALNGEHRNCARHIYANWKKRFNGPLYKKMLWEIVKSTCEPQFHSKLKDLKDESVEAYEHFCEKIPHVFCRALVSPWSKSNSVDNNICETFNSFIIKSRTKPLIDMLEDIRLHLMGRMYDNFQKVEAKQDVLCPNIRKKLEKIQKLVKFCKIQPTVGKKYEVGFFDEGYIVDLVGNLVDRNTLLSCNCLYKPPERSPCAIY